MLSALAAAGILTASGVLVSSGAPAPSSLNGVPAAHLQALQKGINLSHWWAQTGKNGFDLDRQLSFITPHDANLIQEMGFTHVRFTLNARMLWNEDDPAEIPATQLVLYRKHVEWFTKRNIAVVVDCHPEDEFKKELETSPEALDKFTAWWGSLAKSLKDFPPRLVFFEILNEPVIQGPEKWRAMQGKVLQAIRRAAPRHTIIVTADRWSGIDDLLKVKPYSSKNVIYTFHCYDPFLFTHQGATWGWDATKDVKGIPYPTSVAAYREHAAKIENPQIRGYVEDLGRQAWDFDRVKSNLKRAADWGTQNKVPLYLGEFGTYRAYSPPDSRATWIKHTRLAATELGIGWAMWDYCGGFGVVNGDAGKRTPDALTAEALLGDL